MRNRTRYRPFQKPFSEKSNAEQRAEALASIGRLEATLAQGDNRFGEYGRNCRAAIERWQATLQAVDKRELATEPTPIGLQYVIPGCEKDRSRGPEQADLF